MDNTLSVTDCQYSLFGDGRVKLTYNEGFALISRDEFIDLLEGRGSVTENDGYLNVSFAINDPAELAKQLRKGSGDSADVPF